MGIFGATKAKPAPEPYEPYYVREEREKREERARLKPVAESMVAGIKAQQADILAKAEAIHREDAATYDFSCERYGDFLAVRIQRGPQDRKHAGPFDFGRPGKLMATINLHETRTVKLTSGRPPDLGGKHELCMEFDYANIMGPKIVRPFKSYALFVPTRGFSTTASASGLGSWPGMRDFDLGVVVDGIARAATDDELLFVGPGVRVLAPCGMGDGVYQKILTALGTAA